ncbi:MAG: GNAT family N-acetyltransferase [Planctomycetes bacterium]|nr:GNAT family N-acetyltransferase [Planctomycetota bacterium]MCB9934789.1 GNAT family N-acetyltransferase [Planctomycetota bacterium]
MIESIHGEYAIREVGLTPEELAPLAALHHEVQPSRLYATRGKQEKFLQELREGLEGRDALVLAAFDPDGRLVAYKLGYRTGNRRECFYSWLGGVHPFHRRKGLYRALTRLQHGWAKQQGFQYIETHTWGDNPGMMILNLQEGFIASGSLSAVDRPGTRIIMRKLL